MSLVLGGVSPISLSDCHLKALVWPEAEFRLGRGIASVRVRLLKDSLLLSSAPPTCVSMWYVLLDSEKFTDREPSTAPTRSQTTMLV